MTKRRLRRLLAAEGRLRWVTKGVVSAAAAASKHLRSSDFREALFLLCVRCAAPSSSEVIGECLKLLQALRHVCWPAYAAFTAAKPSR